MFLHTATVKFDGGTLDEIHGLMLGGCRTYPFEAKITGGESNQFIE